MKTFQTKLLLLLAAGAFLLSACGAGENAKQTPDGAANANNANGNVRVTKDDLEEFGRIVNLNFTPEEVSWRESATRDTKKLTAVLKFSADDAQAVAAQAERHKPAEPAEHDAENWFAPELVAKSQETGAEILKGTAYAANDFYSEVYKNGRLIRINDTNYFVLELNN